MMSVEIARHYFTADEFERMAERGVFPEDARLELIEGEIIEMSPIGKRHAACVDALNWWLNRKAGEGAIVRVQSPILLGSFSEPQPDIALLKRREDFYRDALPTPADVLLVVEVADTSVEYDRQLKLPIYARAGIAEVWIVNLPDEKIETYALPSGDRYEATAERRRGEQVSSSILPALAVDVDAVL
jgi:Uma2 family endonuclease